LGVGAVGSRVARQLLSGGSVEELLLVDDDLSVAEEAAHSLGPPAEALTVNALRQETRVERFRERCAGLDLVVLTAPTDHRAFAEAALSSGCHVVSTSDDLETVQELLALDPVATNANRSLVVGAGFSPGLTCLLARHGASQLDVIDEIHVAKFGTGGPACARQHHKALRSDGLDWRNQRWEKRRGGSGRALCWFPDPVGGLDCYEAALADPVLMLAGFPEVVRSSARVAATRRDRSTKWLPMLRRPHPEGMIGAIRVELRGWQKEVRSAIVLGALDRPAAAAGTVAALAGRWAVDGRFTRTGSGGLSVVVGDTIAMLDELAALGVRAAVFEGARSDFV